MSQKSSSLLVLLRENTIFKCTFKNIMLQHRQKTFCIIKRTSALKPLSLLWKHSNCYQIIHKFLLNYILLKLLRNLKLFAIFECDDGIL